jgi:hypothetical protein
MRMLRSKLYRSYCHPYVPYMRLSKVLSESAEKGLQAAPLVLVLDLKRKILT